MAWEQGYALLCDVTLETVHKSILSEAVLAEQSVHIFRACVAGDAVEEIIAF